MKIRNIAVICLVLLAAAAFSCKKDKKVETKPSLSGVFFQTPAYMRIGQVENVVTAEVVHPEGKEVGYYWQLDSGKKDTVKTETMTGKVDISYNVSFSTTGTHSVVCGAFADGYYSDVYTTTIEVIDPAIGQYVSGTGVEDGLASITDSRDSKENVYFYKRIGSLDWMCNNLAYTGAGVPYMDCEVTSYPIGRYYTWEEAASACPSGWRLPTYTEWAALGRDAGNLMADAYISGSRMWEFWPDVKITNSTGIAAIPSGYCLVGSSRNVFQGFGDYAAFWTADENASNTNQAHYVFIHEKDTEVQKGSGDKASFALTLRCVR